MTRLDALSRQQPGARFSGRTLLARRNAPVKHRSTGLFGRLHAALASAGDRDSDWDDSEGEWSGEAESLARDPIKRFNFAYTNEDAAAELRQGLEASRQRSLDEYAELKAVLLRRTWRFGALFAAYLALAVSAEAAAAELVGAAAGCGYLLLLMRETDAFTPETAVPLKAAEAVEPPPLRAVAKLLAAYRQAARPRLLIPVGLVAGCAAWNAALPGARLGLLEPACMLGGFASYKVALLLKTYDDLKPRARTEEEMAQALRPSLIEVEDVELDLKRPSQQAVEDAAAVGARDT